MTRNDTTALLLGGSTGMGKATAERLLRRGVSVHLVARDPSKLEAARAELSPLGSVKTSSVDLYDESAVDRFASELEGSEDHIKYLVNAAGYFSPLPFLEHGKADYDRYADLNRATFFLTQAVAKNMRRGGGGSIVNIGSMWAKQAIAATPSAAYSMAKAGLHAMTQHLAMELAGEKIRVNAVSPAVVLTPIYGAFIDPEKIESELQGFNDFHPIGRIGQPDDVAATIVHLLSEDAGWVTGAVVGRGRRGDGRSQLTRAETRRAEPAGAQPLGSSCPDAVRADGLPLREGGSPVTAGSREACPRASGRCSGRRDGIGGAVRSTPRCRGRASRPCGRWRRSTRPRAGPCAPAR